MHSSLKSVSQQRMADNYLAPLSLDIEILAAVLKAITPGNRRDDVNDLALVGELAPLLLQLLLLLQQL